MGFWLICLGTNLLPPECLPSGACVPDMPRAEQVEALSHAAIGWSAARRKLRHECISVSAATLPRNPSSRRDTLRAWATHAERMKPAMLVSIGGRHFAPLLRQMYLQDDDPYPDVLDLAVAGAARRKAHLDFAHVLSRSVRPDLQSFLHAAGLSAQQARATVGLTAGASLLRAVTSLHLTLRILVAAGELSPSEQLDAEDRFLELIESFGEDAAAITQALRRRRERGQDAGQ